MATRLEATGKRMSRIHIDSPFDCSCGNGRISHEVAYTRHYLGYFFLCSNCRQRYFVPEVGGEVSKVFVIPLE